MPVHVQPLEYTLAQAMLVLAAAAAVILAMQSAGICGRNNGTAWLVPLAGGLFGVAVWMGVRRRFRRKAVAVAASLIAAAAVILGTFLLALATWVGNCTA